jgi:biotin carboxylase
VYPSALPRQRLDELGELAAALVPAHGLDACFFNIEFFVPDDGRAQIVELNPRIASQFSPLVEAVHGRPTYNALFALACGADPAWDGSNPNGVAISYVVRVFEDALVEAVPEPQDGLEILVRPGLRLSEQGTNDTASYRLAIFTEWGETREAALRRCRQRAQSLRFDLDEAATGR